MGAPSSPFRGTLLVLSDDPESARLGAERIQDAGAVVTWQSCSKPAFQRFLMTFSERDRAPEWSRADMVSFIGGMAHATRNPLNAAQLQLDAMRRRHARGNMDGFAERIGCVQEEIGRVTKLMNDLLTMLHAVEPVERSVVGLADLVEETILGVERDASRQGIQFNVEVDVELQIEVDRTKLERILRQLLLNAVEAHRDGEDASVTVAATVGDGRLELRVRDKGAGVDPEVEPRVFEPFVTTRSGASGLGLTVVRVLAEMHGGAASLRSVDGGAEATVALALAAPEGGSD